MATTSRRCATDPAELGFRRVTIRDFAPQHLSDCQYRFVVPGRADEGPPTWRVDLSHLDRLTAPAIATDREGRVGYCNGSAKTLLGYARSQLLDAPLLDLIVPEGERGAAEEIMKQVLAGHAWNGEFPLRYPNLEVGRRFNSVQLACSPLRVYDDVAGVLWIVPSGLEGLATPNDPHQLAERFGRLARANAELVAADDIESVTTIVIAHAADAVGATVASLSLRVDEDTLALVGMRGGRQGAASRWATYGVDSQTPAAQAVRTGRSVILNGREAIQRAYPELESAATGERSIICLPLRVTQRSIGVISLSFPGRDKVAAGDLEFLGILSDACAQALERIKALADAADQAAKLEFLANASLELARTLDFETTLRHVSNLAVPKFADWCAISLIQADDLRTLAVAHVDPAMVAVAEELQRRYPSDPNAPRGSWSVLRTGVSELIPEITDEMLVAGTQDAEHLRLAQELDLRSALTVPLTARGRVLGVMAWVFSSDGRRYTPADVTFAENVAGRAAVALDNAQLHSETRVAAEQLQRAVLPDTVPSPEGWQVAAHYSPSGRTEVCGDFYDVIPLADNRLAVFVGDVMGHGVAAAAAMSQMRSALRAYIAVDPTTGKVLHKLDTMFATYDIAQLVTLVYLVFDPLRDEIEIVNAGHPPPMIRRSSGNVEQLAHANGAPLGTIGEPRVATVVGFRSGDALLAFTDGLIERRTEDIDRGQARLAKHGHLLGATSLQDALDELISGVRDHSRSDDVAAVAVRRT